MSTLRKTSVLTVALALVLALLFGAFALFGNKLASAADPITDPGAASGDGVEPMLVQGNPTCADLAKPEESFLEHKVEPVVNGSYPSSNGYLTATISDIHDDGNGPLFNWSSTRGVDKVIVKGGPAADAFVYIPEDTADSSLHAPVNPENGTYFGLSHVSFCYHVKPQVSKTANTTFTRTYKWKVDKKVNSVNPNPLTLRTQGLAGDTGTANYTVSVDKADPAYVDSDWAVSGKITVTNPLNNSSINISKIEDVVSQGNTNTTANVTNCTSNNTAVTFPFSLPANATLECSYSASLGSGTNGTNTATATASGTGIANGVGTANVTFGDPTTEVDKTIKVTDSYSGGPQNQSVSFSDVSSGPKTYTYNRTIGPYAECGDKEEKNTATLYGDSDKILGTASATVTAHVLCNVKVVKTVSGNAPSGDQAFTFELRKDATTAAAGTILETKVANAANSGVINFATGLEPGSTYQICEWVMPGWNTNLSGDGPLFVPESIIPPALPNPNVNNMTVCTNFKVEPPGPTRTFNVDNTPPPGGRALTIGFWKNWASCANSSGKGQKPMLDLALGIASQTTTNPPGGLVVSAQNPGSLWPNYAAIHYLILKGDSTSTNNNIKPAPDCLKAVNLLNKSTIDGKKKMASDPLFNMTAQLVAAQLNRFMGAGISGFAITNIDKAVLLDGKYKFDGLTYSPKLTTADANLANCLATQLDNYNNNRPVSGCP
jgi:hypothetical protein